MNHSNITIAGFLSEVEPNQPKLINDQWQAKTSDPSLLFPENMNQNVTSAKQQWHPRYLEV